MRLQNKSHQYLTVTITLRYMLLKCTSIETQNVKGRFKIDFEALQLRNKGLAY